MGAADASKRSSRLAPLTPSARPQRPAPHAPSQPSASAVAAALALAVSTAAETVLHIASTERRAEEIARALLVFAPDVEVLALPSWDCLPYDRASPSREVMGRRMGALASLNRPAERPRIIVASAEAVSQKLPPAKALKDAFLVLEPGQVLDRQATARFAARTGYLLDERIDEPGEIAFFGEVIDVFPADAGRPFRIALEGDVIREIRAYDPLTQRSDNVVARLELGPASEWVLPAITTDEDLLVAQQPRPPGLEHGLGRHYGKLRTLLSALGPARLSTDPKAAARLAEVDDHVAEAYEARRLLGGMDLDAPAPPSSLYWLDRDRRRGLAGLPSLQLGLTAFEPIQNFALAASPGRAFCDFVQSRRDQGDRVILTGLRHELGALAKALKRGLGVAPEPVADWVAARLAALGTVVTVLADLDTGFVDLGGATTVIAAADVLGGRMARRTSNSPALGVEPDLRTGDVVLHEDHGVGILRDLKAIEVDGVVLDTLQLEYHGGASVLAPIDEIGRIWRYGAEAEAVSLDRLSGEAWVKRRAEVSRAVDAAAERLVAMAAAREARSCPPIEPPKADYARFSARFAYPETPDQADAIAAVLGDLASGKPMDRLVCGDVGFGKTEVALRAAAAVALSGRQVALAAPTTVLARQHVETFKRRFAGTGIAVAHLSRLVSAHEAKAVKAGLASGEIGVVIGTQALAATDVAFKDLGLVIIDEEQKFGARLKEQLRDLATDNHMLTLTATPIPRTLQAAMVGVQDVSVIASPPARRRPIRTFLAPFDPASLRIALLREKRRGGQSFIVAPRIEDITPLAEELERLVPELSVRIAHGGLAAEAADAVMVGFADGDGDILLATNIVESGLDVPRANTMVVWRPERFGLAQLHQLRGRVGRGRVQGVTYLLTDASQDLPEAVRARLSTLEAFDRLGSGLAISERDLDLRGGGDLVGEDQAGHLAMIGAALYQRLLARAVRVARGEDDDEDWSADVQVGVAGAIPTDYVPDAVTRIGLYARLARMNDLDEIDAFEEELEDRFGTLPSALSRLLTLTRLQRLAQTAGVRQVRAGPKGVSLTTAPHLAKRMAAKLSQVDAVVDQQDEKIVVRSAIANESQRMALVERLLLQLV